jgi:hypothetical protein
MKPPLCHILTIVDGKSEEVIDAFEIEAFDLIAFSQQFDVPTETDPKMLDRYSVGPDDATFLENALGFSVGFDFSRYAYFIEAAEKDI